MKSPLLRSLALICLALFAVRQSAHAADRTPNLLIIYTDEHHYNTLGPYGAKVVKTPHIDWLAERGAVADRFYATTPVCSPSRAAFVSGRYPQNTPVIQNNIPLADKVVTFAEALRRKGYATGFAGKWHLDGDGKPQWAPERKFGFEDNRFMFNRGHWKKFTDTDTGPQVAARNAKDQPTYGVDDADGSTFSTDWLTTKAVEFIQAHAEKPFCYMLSLPDPHGPNTVRAPYNTMYVNAEIELPVSLRQTPAQTPGWAPPEKNVNPRFLRAILPQYYGMVKCIDDNVGRLIAALRETGQLENTFIVLTSDHGDLNGEHGKTNKGNPYEGSARIPFILYGPGSVKPGVRVSQALGCVDFLPTILPLMGLPQAVPDQVEGRDASALFRGQAPSDWKDFTVLRSTSGQSWVAAVNADLKLVFSAQDKPWLFDRRTDPHELNNHFSEPAYQDRIRGLARQLQAYGQAHQDPWVLKGRLAEQIQSVANP